jgi:hypothetical protein
MATGYVNFAMATICLTVPHCCLQDEIAKHREQDAASAADFPSGDDDDAADARLLSLEKEIESVFVKRILPDIQKQIKNIVTETANNFFASNIAAF